MIFINSQVLVDALPKWEDVALQPIHRGYLLALRLEWLITSLVLATITGALIFFLPPLRYSYGWAIVAGVTFLIIGFYRFMLEKNFPYNRYAVREKDVLYQSGWIVRRLKVCPNNRIQNCSVQSGPLERRYGLSSLVIFTAGSGSADMKIPGLPQQEAERLRHFILEKIHAEDEGT